MRRKDKSKFWVCALVLSLACIALLNPVPYALFVHAQSATPDAYSGQASSSKVVVHFTEQGAKFISNDSAVMELDNWQGNYYLIQGYYFEAPVGSVIYVSATATPSVNTVTDYPYVLGISKLDRGPVAQPDINENFANVVNGTGSLLTSGTTTKIYNSTTIYIEWDYYNEPYYNGLSSGLCKGAILVLDIDVHSPYASPTPIQTPLSPSTTTVVATTDSGATVNLGISGSIASSQMSNVKITTNPAAATTTVSFTVTGKSGTTGSSTVAIPYSAVPYGTKPTVYIDNNPAQYLVTNDDLYQLFDIWYATAFSTHQVSIVFTTTSNSTPLPTSPEQTSASASPEGSTSLFAGLMFLVIIGIIVVIVIMFVAKRAKTGKPPGASPSQPVPYQAQQQIVYPCPNCGSPLIFIPQYQRYYCQKENRYI